jgi:hypothetical protein
LIDRRLLEGNSKTGSQPTFSRCHTSTTESIKKSEKGGKEHEMAVLHVLGETLNEYLAAGTPAERTAGTTYENSNH